MAIQAAQKAIRDELRRLRTQMHQLDQALSALNGAAPSARPRSKAKTKASPRRRPAKATVKRRLPPEQRQRMIADTVTARPGISTADLAKQLGLSKPRLSQLTKPMLQRRALKRTQDGGWLKA